ncbi:uncharacterized protein [Clytia hemisphaerica]|uniref:Uncharacterized protein n=1 Tax=Clytia hemisphaerica TaxID=252671 RepID=A0A7M5XNY9_9CNID
MGTLNNDPIQTLMEKLRSLKETGEVLACLSEKENHHTFLQWRLKELMTKQPDEKVVDCQTFDWILSDVEILEYLLCSGYVQNNRWVSVINILTSLINVDTLNIKTKAYNKRLAVAVALSFANEIKTLASNGKLAINHIHRYSTYKQWADQNDLFSVHARLSPWLLRFVVSSNAEAKELKWVRENVNSKSLSPDNIGEAAQTMVTLKNNGVKRPLTLPSLKSRGAAENKGISYFCVGMCQGFGIPACVIEQPGHSSFVWWRNGEWESGNVKDGIDMCDSTLEGQWSWNERADYHFLFDEANKVFDKYVTSEKIRWICEELENEIVHTQLLDHATMICPKNYLLSKKN